MQRIRDPHAAFEAAIANAEGSYRPPSPVELVAEMGAERFGGDARMFHRRSWLSSGAKLDGGQLLGGSASGNAKEFHTHHALVFVIVQDDAGLDFLGFHDPALFEAEIQGVVLSVYANPHAISSGDADRRMRLRPDVGQPAY